MQMDATVKAQRLPGYMYETGALVAALRAAGGLVHVAARQLGCDASTIFRRIHKSVKLQQVLRDAREELIDDAESALKLAVKNREPWAITLTLKTIGRTRGYVERLEHTGSDAGPVHFTFEIQRPQYLYRDKEHDKCRQKLTDN
jgi:hypothetical protein